MFISIFDGFIFGGSFGLTGDLCMPKSSQFGVESGRLLITLNARKFAKEQQHRTESLFCDKSKYSGSACALSMSIHYPNYTQKPCTYNWGGGGYL